MEKETKNNHGQHGFSLIELLVALAVSGIVMALIAAAYQAQLRSHNTQVQVVDMQQNLRAAMMIIQKDLRMAGMDPTGHADAGISAAAANTITMTMDIAGGDGDGEDNDKDTFVDESRTNNVDDDGDGLVDEADEEAEWFNGEIDDPALPGETITYALSANGNLQRNNQAIALNIEVLDFVYLDANGVVTADTDDIRSVQVTLIGNIGTPAGLSYAQTDNQIYRNQQGATILDRAAAPDNIRRRMLTSEVKLRNM
jgi:type IV pilus assembly protein PilW